MALWAPYESDQALDLSKSTETVTIQQLSLKQEATEQMDIQHLPITGQKMQIKRPLSLNLEDSQMSMQHSPIASEKNECQLSNMEISEQMKIQQLSLKGIGSPVNSDASLHYPLSPQWIGDYEFRHISPPVASPPERSSSRGAVRRPFRAITAALPPSSAAMSSDPNFEVYKNAVLDAMRARNGGSLTVSNPRMRRSVRRSSDTSEDADYLQRRAKNNAAAKRSRDLRRQKEDELAIRVAYLERQNQILTAELNAATLRRCPNCVYRV